MKVSTILPRMLMILCSILSFCGVAFAGDAGSIGKIDKGLLKAYKERWTELNDQHGLKYNLELEYGDTNEHYFEVESFFPLARFLDGTYSFDADRFADKSTNNYFMVTSGYTENKRASEDGYWMRIVIKCSDIYTQTIRDDLCNLLLWAENIESVRFTFPGEKEPLTIKLANKQVKKDGMIEITIPITLNQIRKVYFTEELVVSLQGEHDEFTIKFAKTVHSIFYDGIKYLLDGLSFMSSKQSIHEYTFGSSSLLFDSNEWETIKRGSMGDSVMWLQEHLSMLGYKLRIDRVFGQETDIIVKKYQYERSIGKSGIVDGEVITAIIEDCYSAR